jgi:outer membrane protein, heavy metal efflux system
LPEIHSEADLLALADRSRPLLAQRKHAIDAAQARLELAKKDYYPDFTLGAGYAFRQDTLTGQSRSDFANFRLSMNLPIYVDSKQAKAVDQRNSELLKERYALDEAEHKTQTEIAASLALYQASREQFKLFEDSIVPLAQQTVTSALTSYQVGKTDFLNVVRAANAWFDYQMQYWHALADAHQALARLLAAVGQEAP